MSKKKIKRHFHVWMFIFMIILAILCLLNTLKPRYQEECVNEISVKSSVNIFQKITRETHIGTQYGWNTVLSLDCEVHDCNAKYLELFNNHSNYDYFTQTTYVNKCTKYQLVRYVDESK